MLAAGLERAAAGGARASDALERLAAGSRAWPTASARRRAPASPWKSNFTPSFPACATRLCGEHAASPTNSKRRHAATRRCGGWRKQERLLARVLASERDKVRTMRDVAIELHGALERSPTGGTRLEDGTRRLAGSASGLQDGLEQLSAGAASSRRRARRPATAAPGRCNAGLANGFQPLLRAAARARAGRRPRQRRGGPSGSRRRASCVAARPHLFDSGYFVLSALDGAPPVPRALAGEAVNVGRGGQAARLLVVSTDPFNTAGSRATGELLDDRSRSAWRGKATW